MLVVLLAGGGIFVKHALSNTVTYMRRVAKVEADQSPGVMDVESRIDTWTTTIRMCEDHRWFGVGPGHFDYRFREYRPQRFQMRPEHAHDDYLELFADWGAVGGLIVFGGLGLFIYGLVKTWPHVRREENTFGSGMSSRYALFLGGTSGLFALAAHSFVDFNLHVPANMLVAITILALITASLRFATKRYWVRLRLPLQCTLTVILAAGILYLGTQVWRRSGELYWIARAKAQPAFSEAQAAAWQRALAWEPNNYQNAFNLGECYRVQSLDGGDNYAELASKALDAYAIGARLNPDDAYCRLRSGMCLDWLGKHTEAEPYYWAAESLDPNGNYVVANMGWHYVQIGDYAAARQWFARAFKLSFGQNEMAKNYLFSICEPKLRERASGRLPMGLYYSGKDN